MGIYSIWRVSSPTVPGQAVGAKPNLAFEE
jgi:hypothetical protein